MGTYVPDRTALPVGLDEAGLRLGLQRLPEESLHKYRQRLLHEARDPANPSQTSYIRGVGRKIGALDIPVFDIELVLDSNDAPLASRPFLEVTSTHLRAYYDYDSKLYDVEVFFEDRADGWWLEDVLAAFAASTYFTATALADYSQYLRSRNLRFGNTGRHRATTQLFPSYQNRLPDSNLVEILFENRNIFSNEVDSISLVVADGDFFVDYNAGQVFSHAVAQGTCSYTYAEFPYRIHWQSVSVVPLDDPDLKYRHKDELVSDDSGELERARLSPEGASVYNRVLAVHPLGWGE
jgi:hypothetical protein